MKDNLTMDKSYSRLCIYISLNFWINLSYSFFTWIILIPKYCQTTTHLPTACIQAKPIRLSSLNRLTASKIQSLETF